MVMLGAESSTTPTSSFLHNAREQGRDRERGRGEGGDMLVNEEWVWPSGFTPPSDFLSDPKKVGRMVNLQQCYVFKVLIFIKSYIFQALIERRTTAYRTTA